MRVLVQNLAVGFLREFLASTKLLLTGVPGQLHRFDRYLGLLRVLLLVQLCDSLADSLALVIHKECLSTVQQCIKLAFELPDLELRNSEGARVEFLQAT